MTRALKATGLQSLPIPLGRGKMRKKPLIDITYISGLRYSLRSTPSLSHYPSTVYQQREERARTGWRQCSTGWLALVLSAPRSLDLPNYNNQSIAGRQSSLGAQSSSEHANRRFLTGILSMSWPRKVQNLNCLARGGRFRRGEGKGGEIPPHRGAIVKSERDQLRRTAPHRLPKN